MLTKISAERCQGPSWIRYPNASRVPVGLVMPRGTPQAGRLPYLPTFLEQRDVEATAVHPQLLHSSRSERIAGSDQNLAGTQQNHHSLDHPARQRSSIAIRRRYRMTASQRDSRGATRSIAATALKIPEDPNANGILEAGQMEVFE